MTIDAAARQILFRMGLGTHHFLAIAKLRAARRLWARVVEACGGSPTAGAMRIHARTSNRVLTRRDPYVNLLRNTVAVFAAGVGGADAITSVPFDAMTGLARRVSAAASPAIRSWSCRKKPICIESSIRPAAVGSWIS